MPTYHFGNPPVQVCSRGEAISYLGCIPGAREVIVETQRARYVVRGGPAIDGFEVRALDFRHREDGSVLATMNTPEGAVGFAETTCQAPR